MRRGLCALLTCLKACVRGLLVVCYCMAPQVSTLNLSEHIRLKLEARPLRALNLFESLRVWPPHGLLLHGPQVNTQKIKA